MGLEQTASTAASTAPAVATAADAAPAGAPAPAAGLVAGAASAAQPAPGAAATAAGTAAAPSFSRRFARWIGQGESTVASVGIIAAAILLSTMAASSWWTERTQRQQLARWRGEHVRSLVNTLSVSLESMLAYNELTQARRLLAEVARSDDLTLCRVTLPDGRVVADAVPSKINVQQLPETWPRRAAVLQEFSADNGEVRATQPLMIPGRGPAALELAAPLVHAPGARWETQAGVGAIGAGALVCMLVFYRHLRARMRAIGAVRDALLALGRGERARAVLSVNPQLGAEAGPWNALLAEVEQLTRQLQVEQAKEVLASRRSARGDLDAAFDALPQGLVLVDEQLRIRYVNGAAAVFLTAKRELLPNTDVTQWIAQDEVLASLKGVSDGTMRRKTTVEVEHRPGGAAPTILRFTVRPVRREDFAAAMIMIEDITQQKVAAESRNHFVAQATHELRTPLTNIRLYVETAIDEGERDPAVRGKCLNVINQETRRLERIVGEMLSVAEIEAGSLKIKRDDLRVDQLFDEIRADFQQQAAEKQIKLNFRLPPKMPVVQADRDKIAVALHNLIGNALKYTPEKGSVTVSLDVEPKQLVVTVSDTGIGIGEDDQGKIFDRFYRAQDPRVAQIAGTGLGLTLAREVVRLHGGDIVVRSELNKGSTFTLTLPSHAEAA